VLEDMIDRQSGVVTRAQALSAGLTPDAVRARVGSGRWQVLHRAVYFTFSGPVPTASRRWAAVLRAGRGAVLSHETAAELHGLAGAFTPALHVSVPAARRVSPIPGVVVHRSSELDTARHPSRLPPQTRIEETVIDLTQTCASLDDAIGWVTRACGRRLTRPERLLAVLDRRRRARWRAELVAILRDVADGAHSALEVRYLRDVERAHELPPASRQHVVTRAGGRSYDDVRYRAYGVVVELDGRMAHPAEARWRDMRRDNAAAVDGRTVLRYGWTDVACRPCEVAAQVAGVLRAAGWRGVLRRCRAGCPASAESFGGYDPSNSP
jgi:hypothetical protein